MNCGEFQARKLHAFWLPDAHTVQPTPNAAFLSTVRRLSQFSDKEPTDKPRGRCEKVMNNEVIVKRWRSHNVLTQC